MAEGISAQNMPKRRLQQKRGPGFRHVRCENDWTNAYGINAGVGSLAYPLSSPMHTTKKVHGRMSPRLLILEPWDIIRASDSFHLSTLPSSLCHFTPPPIDATAVPSSHLEVTISGGRTKDGSQSSMHLF